MNIAVACGGTGGHIFPGLATARELQRRGHEVVVWLAGKSIEGLSVENWDGPVESVRAAGFPSGVSWRAIGTLGRLAAAVTTCFRRMRRRRPDVVLAMGSYASVGPVLAARGLGIPVVLHEANAIPGRAVRWLSRWATAVGIAFESAALELQGRRTVITGMPVRPKQDGRLVDPALRENGFTVLVMGGSQGAHRLNEIVPRAVARVRAMGVDIQVIHLSGAADRDAVRAAYRDAGVDGMVLDFLSEVGLAYNRANLAICRAGAATCAELVQYGLPALLVPYPMAQRDHQMANARALEAAGVADVLPEHELEERTLGEYLARRCREGIGRRPVPAAGERLLPSGAAQRLADLVESCAVSA